MAQLKPTRIALTDLEEAPWNYKRGSEGMRAKLRANLQRNGQVDTLVVRKLPSGRLEVINGNHRLQEMRALGWEDAWVFNLGVVDDARARQLSLELNEVRAEPDMHLLATLAENVVLNIPAEELALTSPYDVPELRDLAAMANESWDMPLESPVKSRKKGMGGGKGDGELRSIDVPVVVYNEILHWQEFIAAESMGGSLVKAIQLARRALKHEGAGVSEA